ncbi:MAG TPA: helix-turn-helix domain-containing protein [bacterium]|nr:helix-turn-helix domain-containing protein [bacterium]HPS29766.1 helix-turn-helix domain-containing protein [bacterium]
MKRIIGQSDTAKKMRRFLQYSKKEGKYLIGGESGTGKYFLASLINSKLYSKEPAPMTIKLTTPEDLSKEGYIFITSDRRLFDATAPIMTSSIWLDPLREREIDIAELTEFFIQESGASSERWYTSKSMKLLVDYWWPYNVKELKKVVTTVDGYKALPYANMKKILSNYSATEIVSIKVESFWGELGENVSPGKFYQLFIDSIERVFIKSALKQCGGSISKTAQLLNIHRNTLTQKMKKFGIKL